MFRSYSQSQALRIERLRSSSPVRHASFAEADADETCSICLLPMGVAEGVTVCASGCRNALHAACMAVWADSCVARADPVTCPLCRTTWRHSDDVAAKHNLMLKEDESNVSP